MFSRRQWLTIGGLSAMPCLSPTAITSAAVAGSPLNCKSSPTFGRAKRCLLLFLTGGPSQYETWDPKPDASDTIRGEFSPIATSVPGVIVSEMFPRLAAMAQQFRLVRSLTHVDTVHMSAGYAMLTGGMHPQANLVNVPMLVKPSPVDRPHLGCVVHKFRSEQEPQLPPFALPEIIKDAAVNEFPGLNSGFLSKRHEPVLIEANASRTEFLPPPISLPLEISRDRLQARLSLRTHLEPTLSQDAPQRAELLYRSALDLVESESLQRAFRLEDESAAIREAYGSHLFGQGALLARRLLEADARFVTIYWHYEGPDDSPVWDTHWNNFRHMRQRLAPPTDRAVSQLLNDLSECGLLDETLVLCLGEFGRTPKINHMAGRDHWPHIASALVAGAGVPGGTVVGASDRDGAYPAHTPITPEDWGTNLLHWLGVSSEQLLHDQLGRPHRAGLGTIRSELFG